MSSVFTRAIVELETEKTGVSPLNAKCVFREVLVQLLLVD